MPSIARLSAQRQNLQSTRLRALAQWIIETSIFAASQRSGHLLHIGRDITRYFRTFRDNARVVSCVREISRV
jgi:hypothetical protein